MPKGFPGTPREECGLAPDERRKLVRRTEDSSAAHLGPNSGSWAESQVRAYGEAVAQAIRVLRAIAAADQADVRTAACPGLDEEISLLEAVVGPTQAVVQLPSIEGDLNRLRDAKDASRGDERQRGLWREWVPVPDRRSELRRAEDVPRAKEIALAATQERLRLALISAMGMLGREEQDYDKAGAREMRDFLRAEGFALSEIFAGRIPPATLDERLHARRLQEIRAEERGYKD